MRAREAGQRSVASTLPAPSTLLIGRDQDVAAARERLLAPHVRLLTFTGPAGTGKTRLALAVAASVQAEFADGIHFVDLAPIRDPTLVHTAIAQVLGVRDAGDQPLRQTLLLYVQPRQLALMLDNFEQVIDAAPLVAESPQWCCPPRSSMPGQRWRQLTVSGAQHSTVCRRCSSPR